MQQLEITVRDLKQKMDEGEPLYLLDVREPFEWNIAHLEGATLIPIGEIMERRSELPKDEEIVVYCHLGSRSLQVAHYLQNLGYNAHSVNGGVEDWATYIDPTMPRY
jgi:sulfur-carrier protein adenylyltransferase/sulfurtransferase